MNTQNAFLVLVIGILSAGCHTLAERPQPSPTPFSAQADYKVATKQENRNGEVVTIVSLERMSIASPDAVGEPIGFSSMFVYDEKSQSVPSAYISFYSMARKCRFPSKAEVTFFVDGQAINLSDDPEAAERREGTATSLIERTGDACKESLDVILPQKVYVSIANAQMVAVQFGRLRLTLNEKHLKALHELARRMVATKPR